jgi:hypothetical protein
MGMPACQGKEAGGYAPLPRQAAGSGFVLSTQPQRFTERGALVGRGADMIILLGSARFGPGEARRLQPPWRGGRRRCGGATAAWNINEPGYGG